MCGLWSARLEAGGRFLEVDPRVLELWPTIGRFASDLAPHLRLGAGSFVAMELWVVCGSSCLGLGAGRFVPGTLVRASWCLVCGHETEASPRSLSPTLRDGGTLEVAPRSLGLGSGCLVLWTWGLGAACPCHWHQPEGLRSRDGSEAPSRRYQGSTRMWGCQPRRGWDPGLDRRSGPWVSSLGVVFLVSFFFGVMGLGALDLGAGWGRDLGRPSLPWELVAWDQVAGP